MFGGKRTAGGRVGPFSCARGRGVYPHPPSPLSKYGEGGGASFCPTDSVVEWAASGGRRWLVCLGGTAGGVRRPRPTERPGRIAMRPYETARGGQEGGSCPTGMMAREEVVVPPRAAAGGADWADWASAPIHQRRTGLPKERRPTRTSQGCAMSRSFGGWSGWTRRVRGPGTGREGRRQKVKWTGWKCPHPLSPSPSLERGDRRRAGGRSVAPLQGLAFPRVVDPGRCPGLRSSAPSGRTAGMQPTTSPPLRLRSLRRCSGQAGQAYRTATARRALQERTGRIALRRGSG